MSTKNSFIFYFWVLHREKEFKNEEQRCIILLILSNLLDW